MADAFNDYRHKLTAATEQWKSLTKQYVAAFGNACDSYDTVSKEQQDSDKKEAESISFWGVLATTLVVPFGLIAIFGTASLGVLALDAVLSALAATSARQALRAFSEIALNSVVYLTEKPAVMFLLGGLATEAQHGAKDWLKNALLDANVNKDEAIRAEKALTDMLSDLYASLDGSLYKVDPLAKVPKNQVDKLNLFIGDLTARATRFVNDLESKDVPEVAKIQMLERWKAAPLLNPTWQAIHFDDLSRRIELSFYMALLLHSAYLSQYDYSPEAALPFVRSKPATDMTESPSWTDAGGGLHFSQAGVYDPGSKFHKRIDDLYGAIYGSRSTFYRPGSTKTTPEDFHHAQAVLKKLGEDSERSIRFNTPRPLPSP
jgi:hypothetical protein